VIPSRSPRAVIDTNVLLDFWIFDDPATRDLRMAIEQGRVVALRSAAQTAELVDVLQRSKFALSVDRQRAILQLWDSVSVPIEVIGAAPIVCTDPDDQKFLELAFSGRADWLISKDKALLRLARHARRLNLLIAAPAALPAPL
jgi:uncharacterized protein